MKHTFLDLHEFLEYQYIRTPEVFKSKFIQLPFNVIAEMIDTYESDSDWLVNNQTSDRGFPPLYFNHTTGAYKLETGTRHESLYLEFRYK